MIKELLGHGKENALTSVQLINACGFTCKRELQDQIARERAAGAVICSTTSGNGGYYLPKDRAEVACFIKSMDSRVKNISKSISAARKYLEELEGQQSLNLENKRE